MTEPTERQVLYALVAGGFLLVVLVLIVFAAVSGLSPVWWTTIAAVAWALGTGYTVMRWRATGRVLLLSIALFAFWTIGTLVTR